MRRGETLLPQTRRVPGRESAVLDRAGTGRGERGVVERIARFYGEYDGAGEGVQYGLSGWKRGYDWRKVMGSLLDFELMIDLRASANFIRCA